MGSDVFGGALEAWREYASWQSVRDLGNSSFGTSLVGALAGAYFGAHAASWIAKRDKIRDELSEQIRLVNAALAITFSLLNSFLAFKKQHALPIKKNLDDERLKLQRFQDARKLGEAEPNGRHTVRVDLRSIHPAVLPINELFKLVLERIAVTGRPLNMMVLLGEYAEHLNGFIVRRNELINEFRSGHFPEGADLPTICLGLPFGDGHINQEYPSLVDGLVTYTDDVIFFAYILSKDLTVHGEGILKRFRAECSGAIPRLTKLDFKDAQDAGLIPPEEQYRDVLNAFVPQPLPKVWWRRWGGQHA